MRTLLAAAAVALAAATTTPAAATPTFDAPDVRRHVTGVATTHFLATNKSVYRVTVNVSAVYTDSTTPYSWIEVRVAQCAKGTCATPVVYFAPLAKTTNYDTGNLKNVTAKLSAFGRPVVVTWQGAGPASDYDTNPTVAETVVDLASTWPATAKVTFLGVTCTDTKATAARHQTLYAGGFEEPKGMVPIPAKAPFGQPAAAKSCRPGPA